MLYDILKDRAAVNLLKILCDNEKENKSYSLKRSAIKLSILEANIRVLEENSLLLREYVAGDEILAITEKGKQFIAAMDRLVLVLSPKEEAKPKVEVEYSLTEMEKKILMLLLKIETENNGPVQVKQLTQELYPYEEPSRKQSAVSRELSKLEDIHLVKKEKRGKFQYTSTTESGKRVAEKEIKAISGSF